MKQTLSKTQFISLFRDIRPENFSGPALSALFDYLEQMEEGMGEEMEFDPIAICCDFGEYTEKELMREYGEPLKNISDQYRYVIDHDERGEFRATIYEIPEDREAMESCRVTVTEQDFAEGGELESINPYDSENVVGESLPYYIERVLSETGEPETEGDDDVNDVIDRLEDETLLLTVEQWEGEPTYIVQSF